MPGDICYTFDVLKALPSTFPCSLPDRRVTCFRMGSAGKGEIFPAWTWRSKIPLRTSGLWPMRTTQTCRTPERTWNPAPCTASQIFLPYRAYSKDTLQKLLEDRPYPDYQGLLEKYFTVDTVAAAMGNINRAVSDLDMLLVEPYLHMEETYKSGNFN